MVRSDKRREERERAPGQDVCDNIMIILAPWRVFAEFTPSSAYLWWRRTKTDKSTLEQDNKYLHFTASLSPDSICIKNNWILNCFSPIKTVSQPSDIRSQNIVHVTKTIYSRVRLSCLWLVAGCNHFHLIGYLYHHEWQDADVSVLSSQGRNTGKINHREGQGSTSLCLDYSEEGAPCAWSQST